MRVLVTGANGFVGKNVCAALAQRKEVDLAGCDVQDAPGTLDRELRLADVVFHLAGVNRPADPLEFERGNAHLTATVCEGLAAAGRKAKIVLASSVQVERDNPYARSKLAAEREVRSYAERTGAEGVVYRLKNLFGKWCRPNYNSVTATFCHNIARGLPIQISDPSTIVDLTYVDDVVTAFVSEIDAAPATGFRLAPPLESYAVSLGDLARMIESFRDHRSTLILPDWSNRFVRALYATYLAQLEPDSYGYSLTAKSDARGSLAEFIKSSQLGQIFVSRTKPGVTRGNHYHHTKTEKFLVVQGEALIRLRQIHGDVVLEHRVRGSDFRVVDIPPGYTHSIENVGPDELVTLFWSSEVFDPSAPDTIFDPVLPATR